MMAVKLLSVALFVSVMLNNSYGKSIGDMDKTVYKIISDTEGAQQNLNSESPEFEIVFSEDHQRIEDPDSGKTNRPKHQDKSESVEHFTKISNFQRIKSVKDKNPNRKQSCIGPITLMAMCF